MSTEEGLGGAGPAQRSTLKARFHERRIKFETMEARLRLATAGAAAFLVAGAILVALRGIKATGVYLGESAQGVTSIPEPMFIASLVLIAVGFAYMLTGAALASPSVAVPSTIVIVGGVGLYTGAFGSVIGGLSFFEVLPSWARWTLRGLLAGIALLAVAAIAEGAILRRRSRPEEGDHPSEEHRHGVPDRAVRLVLLATLSVLFGAYLLVLRAASPTLGGLNNFGPLISAVLITIAIALYPILTVAAVDFAEWGEMASDFVTGRVEGLRAAWVFHFSVLCSVGLAVYAYALLLPGRGIFSAGRIVHALDALLIVAIVIGVIIGGGRLLRVAGREWPESLNFAALAVVCAVVTVIVPPIGARLSGELSLQSSPVLLEGGHYAPGADVVTMANSGQPTFSLLIPRGWLQHVDTAEVVASDYLGGEQQVLVAHLPQVTLQEGVTAFKLTPSGPPVSDGRWQMLAGSSPGYGLAEVWVTPAPVAAGGGDYLMLARSNLADPKASAPLFEAAAASFSPAGSPLATAPPAADTGGVPLSLSDHTYVYGIAIEVALCVVLLLLVRLFGRRWPVRAVGAVLLLAVVTVFAAAFGLDSFGRVLVGPGARWSALGERGLELSLALASLAALLLSRWARPGWEWPRRMAHRLPDTVIVLVGATFLLDGTTRLYSGMLSAGRVPITAAILVLLASAWDILMSGESMTNEGSPRLPRVTRVLAFFGYSILLSGMVLFYTAQKTIVGGQKVESLFEPEAITQGGLFRVALPLVLLLLLLRLFGAGSPEPVAAGPGPRDDGDQLEQPREGAMALTGED